MTAEAGNDEEQGLELGASDWIQKPLNYDQLVVRIHNQLKIRKQKNRAHQIAAQTNDASSVAIHQLAHTVLGSIDDVEAHWVHFFKTFGTEPEICTPQMSEEMPALLHELRADLTRIVRITEGT